MNARNSRSPASSPASRMQGALIHRGPGATAAPYSVTPAFHHAPNAALLIDFDNVTMGIRSDLGKELRTLLSSDIIKGKVAVQRAYADWRRYPQYIVPLSEASIDLIFAPAYGTSKKNATDIRLAIDALELVFTRPEIGTFILLSGDSDFSSLVIKLKEYGKYVIGVGIRESSSDLLVQNCDEYYSYNALAGLVKASEETPARKFDPWELVSEAVTRMKSNGDVMRSDRLKQVMQDIDPAFDEKSLGMSKFSRFVQEAAQRGLLSVTKLENGQLEIGLPAASTRTEGRAIPIGAETAPESQAEAPAAEAAPEERGREERGREERGRRGRRGRGRGREREREERGQGETAGRAEVVAPLALVEEPEAAPAAGEQIGISGERLTRNEAFDLVRRAVETLTTDDSDSTRASDVRRRAREILGRDSESLSERMFIRILKDAHDAGIVDLRRRGDDFEVARAAEVPSVRDQVARADAAAAPASAATTSVAPRLGMGPRGAGARGRPRLEAPPPELLSVGIVEEPSAAAAASAAEEATETPAVAPSRGSGGRGGRGGRKRAPGSKAAEPQVAEGRAAAVEAAEPVAATNGAAPPAKRGRARAAAKTRGGARGRAKRAASKASEE